MRQSARRASPSKAVAKGPPAATTVAYGGTRRPLSSALVCWTAVNNISASPGASLSVSRADTAATIAALARGLGSDPAVANRPGLSSRLAQKPTYLAGKSGQLYNQSAQPSGFGRGEDRGSSASVRTTVAWNVFVTMFCDRSRVGAPILQYSSTRAEGLKKGYRLDWS